MRKESKKRKSRNEKYRKRILFEATSDSPNEPSGGIYLKHCLAWWAYPQNVQFVNSTERLRRVHVSVRQARAVCRYYRCWYRFLWLVRLSPFRWISFCAKAIGSLWMAKISFFLTASKTAITSSHSFILRCVCPSNFWWMVRSTFLQFEDLQTSAHVSRGCWWDLSSGFDRVFVQQTQGNIRTSFSRRHLCVFCSWLVLWAQQKLMLWYDEKYDSWLCLSINKGQILVCLLETIGNERRTIQHKRVKSMSTPIASASSKCLKRELGASQDNPAQAFSRVYKLYVMWVCRRQTLTLVWVAAVEQYIFKQDPVS